MLRPGDLLFPDWFSEFFKPYRYKGAYGGRGSSKSHSFAAQIIMEMSHRPGYRAVCIREIQNSIKDSVKQLLEDKIQAAQLDEHFDITEQEIRGPNDSLCIFRGMQAFNAARIKSLEGFDVAWVEEAQDFSQRSLDLLRPTIRKPCSELRFTWNPRHDTDAVDAFLRGPTRPTSALVREVNWQANPWFPDVLRQEKDEDYATDPERAEHIWGGQYELITEAAYYARDILKAERDGRICFIPLFARLPLMTSWDIGVEDYTSVFLWQEDGETAYVQDFYETSGVGPEEAIEYFARHYGDAFFRGPHYFPHDVRMREWGAGARSRVETLHRLGVQNIQVGAAMKPEERINAARQLLPHVMFNDTENVRQGLRHLRRYRRARNELMGVWKGPQHDEHSHAADAFGEFAVNGPFREQAEPPKPAEPMKSAAYHLPMPAGAGLEG